MSVMKLVEKIFKSGLITQEAFETCAVDNYTCSHPEGIEKIKLVKVFIGTEIYYIGECPVCGKVYYHRVAL